ncbi:MAG: hypothetical protein LBC03_07545, partial [Nitrososphaerota archaeon]|nr:hypothetical protein [Nitrososphaerota archaeon]
WLPKYTNDKSGQSIIVCRSQCGKTLLERSAVDRAIIINAISIDEVLQSQKRTIRSKKTKARQARVFVYSMLMGSTPKFISIDPLMSQQHRKLVFQLPEAFVRCTLVYVASKHNGKLPTFAMYAIGALMKLGLKFARKK